MRRSFTRADALDALEQSREMFKNANESVKAVRDTMRRIRSAVADNKGDAVMTSLQEVSVDKLAGIVPPRRIQLLKDNGVNTIADIYKRGSAGIKSINGIGTKTVAAIMEASDKMRTEVGAKIPFELTEDPNAMTAAQRDLVYRACLYLDTRSNLAELERLIDDYGIKRRDYAASLSRATTSLGWLFSGRNQRADEEEAYAGMLTLIDGTAGQELRHHAEAIREAFTSTTQENAITRYISDENLRHWILTDASTL